MTNEVFSVFYSSENNKTFCMLSFITGRDIGHMGFCHLYEVDLRLGLRFSDFAQNLKNLK